MLSLVHNCSSSDKKTMPNVLMAYSVGRRSVITNTFQKSNVEGEDDNEEAANRLEEKLREGVEFIDPNAEKCEIVSFLDQAAPIQRITAVGAAASHANAKSVLAMAEMDYKNPAQIYVSFYDMVDSDKQNLSDEEFPYFNTGKERLKVNMEQFMTSDELQRFKLGNTKPTHQKQEDPIKCHGAARTGMMRTPTLKVAEDPMDQHYDFGPIQIFVSQIVFSHDLKLCALLVSGGQNGILVYSWQEIITLGHKLKQYSSVIFEDSDLNSCIAKPTDSMDEAKSRFDNQKIKHPKVTEIRFNPNSSDQLSLSGPYGALGLASIRKDNLEITWMFSKFHGDNPILDLAESTEGIIDPERESVTWSGHAWISLVKDEHLLLMIACSEEGHVLMMKPTSDQVISCFKSQSETDTQGRPIPDKFVSVQACQLGFVLATEAGYLHFYEYSHESKNRNSPELQQDHEFEGFDLVRTWRCTKVSQHLKVWANSQCPDDHLKLTSIEILDASREQNILAATFNNKSVYTLNLWDQVYSTEKKEDLEIKKKEHIKVVEKHREDTEAKAHAGGGGSDANMNDKAYLDAEYERILDLKFNMMTNLGNHSTSINNMDICLQRPVILTSSVEEVTNAHDKSKAGKQHGTVRLFNYVTNTCELAIDYSNLFLKGVALHASGYYMAIAFDDYVKLYHILYQDLEEFHTYTIKHTQQLKFSSCGQYLFAADQKVIWVISTYQMEIIGKLQCPSVTNQPQLHLSFNEKDSCLSVVSSDGFMQRYDLFQLKKKDEASIQKECKFTSSIFIEDHLQDKDEFKVICVGQEREIPDQNNEAGACMRIIDKEGNKDVKQYEKGRYTDTTEQLISKIDSKYREHTTRPLFPRYCTQNDKENKVLQINDICKIKPMNDSDLMSLAVGTNRGTVQLFGCDPVKNIYPEKNKIHQTIHCHYGQVSHIAASHDGKRVFSAGEDGAIFVYKVVNTSQPRRKQKVKKANKKQTGNVEVSSTVSPNQTLLSPARTNNDKDSNQDGDDDPISADSGDEENVMKEEKVLEMDQLGRVILVTKDQMTEWKKQQETLQSEMSSEAEKVNMQVREKQIKFDKRVSTMEITETNESNELHLKIKELGQQNADQQDEAKQKMQKMEKDHDQLKEELLGLYEKKLAYEEDQYKDLKFLQKRTKTEYEDEISQLHKQHEKAIETLLEEFKTELHKVQDKYELSKRTTDGLKMINEEKLTQQEADQFEDHKKIEDQQKMENTDLQAVLDDLQNDIVAQDCKLRRHRDDTKKFERMEAYEKDTFKQQKAKADELTKEIEVMEEKKQTVQSTLKKKEIELYKKKFAIEELQKTKHVLAHRTQEMKASLEPKEQQIESLKEQLLDFEKVWDVQKRALDVMLSKVEEKKEKVKEKEKKVAEEQTEVKGLDKKIGDFTQAIKDAMKAGKDRDYVIGLADIYQNHAKNYTGAILDKEKKPETIEEVDRKARFLEEMMTELSKKTKLNMKLNKESIQTRTRENTKLIAELNDVRQRQQQNLKDISASQKIRDELSLKIKQMKEAKSDAEMGQKGNRVGQGSEVSSLGNQQLYRQKSGVGSGGLGSEIGDEDDEDKQIKRSQSRGKIIKGTMFNAKPTGIYKHQIQNLMKQLHETNQHVFVRNLELASLKEEFRNTIRELGNQMDANQVQQLEKMFSSDVGSNSPSGMSPDQLGQYQAQEMDENYNNN